ncbi:MAG: hypothetical protein ACKO47_02890, partial [Alphaproteobacteria bacterium]
MSEKALLAFILLIAILSPRVCVALFNSGISKSAYQRSKGGQAKPYPELQTGKDRSDQFPTAGCGSFLAGRRVFC